MRQKLDFLFLGEIWKREERSYILLCEELRRRGYTAEYYFADEWTYRKFKKRVNVVVGNCIINTRTIGEQLYAIVGKAKKAVNLRWEQIPVKGEEPMEYEQICNTARFINWLCWGDDYVNLLRKVRVDEKHIHKVGPIHMDFLRPQFSELYLSRDFIQRTYEIKEDKKILFFISSFMCYNDDPDYYELTCSEMGKEYTDKLFKYDKNAIDNVLDWFERLLILKQDWCVIYRPHPGAPTYKRLMEMQKKYDLYIIPDYSVQQWFNAVDVIALVNSTVISEVYFSGKPFLLLEPYCELSMDNSDMKDNVKRIMAFDDFVDSLEKPIRHEVNKIDRYYNFEETPSYIRICDCLERIYHCSEYDIIWDQYEFGKIKSSARKAHIYSFRNDCKRKASGIFKKTVGPIIRKVYQNRVAKMKFEFWLIEKSRLDLENEVRSREMKAVKAVVKKVVDGRQY